MLRRATDTQIVPRPSRAAAYLAIPRDYVCDLGGGLHWSSTGEAIECSDQATFAFAAEAILFLEGFASQRPLIPFGCVLRLLHLLRPRVEALQVSPPFALLRTAFVQAGRNYRNAGVFAAHLCSGVPSSPDPPNIEDLWRWLTLRETGLQGAPDEPPEVPPLSPPAFEARVERALVAYSHDEMVRWARDGSGPLYDAGEALARQVQPPSSLAEVLDGVFQRERLGGAIPFVDQLVSVVALPPRRLTPPELPIGGYADVTTHGQLEQLLPSQLAYDDLEFVRRVAQRELLFFRREEPHVSVREELVVVLDQGVRTWGTVRLVLAAAVLALGRLAERRRAAFFLAGTSNGGHLIDPISVPAAEVGAILEASDLSRHPGLALEKVLQTASEMHRDIVLLTHPRNLAEADVHAAALRVQPGVRAFALSVDDCGSAAFSELRHGTPVPLTNFSIDLNPPEPKEELLRLVPAGQWGGDVEPVPTPFVFGPGGAPIHAMAFDCAGDWLLVATNDGMLYATRTDGSRMEVLPRGMVDGRVLRKVWAVGGARDGFVVLAGPNCGALLHYDFTTRTCKAHRWRLRGCATLPEALYIPPWHTVILKAGNEVECIQLTTGSREVPPALASLMMPFTRQWRKHSSYWVRLSPPGLVPCRGRWDWPSCDINPDTGKVSLRGVAPTWDDFVPEADGRPILMDWVPLGGMYCGVTLVILVTPTSTGGTVGHIFRGPPGTYVGELPLPRSGPPLFELSRDGQLLARAVTPAQVEVRDVFYGGPPKCVTRSGGFHSNVTVELGETWLALGAERVVHLVRWGGRQLCTSLGKSFERFLSAAIATGEITSRGSPAKRLPGGGPLWLVDRERFHNVALRNNLIAAVDRFGQVALFQSNGTFVAMFFAFRQELAIWLPDGTVYGSQHLLGQPKTPQAAEKIGAALWEATKRSGGGA
jgi:hypothetical protein